jgi:hypothetical protein
MFVPHRKHLWDSTACYGDCFAHSTQTYGTPWPVMGMTSLYFSTLLRRSVCVCVCVCVCVYIYIYSVCGIVQHVFPVMIAFSCNYEP